MQLEKVIGTFYNYGCQSERGPWERRMLCYILYFKGISADASNCAECLDIVCYSWALKRESLNAIAP